MEYNQGATEHDITEHRTAVELFFYNEYGQLLMAERGEGKHGAGTTAVPGGHAKPYETLNEAAIREAQEELGKPLCDFAATAFKQPDGSAIEPYAVTVQAAGKANLFAIVDDKRVMNDGRHITYTHYSFAVQVSHDAAPNPAAPDAAEHNNFRWRTQNEIKEMLHEGKIFGPHRMQIESFLGFLATGCHGADYYQILGLQ